MSKEKDKQKEANRERQRRYKARQKGVNSEGVTDESITFVTPEGKGVTFIEGEDDPNDGTMSIETLAMMDIGCGNKLDHGLKRGKDIKCFADLPPDVRTIINSMSTVDGKIDQKNKADRTEAAIHYTHLFLDKFYSTGVV